jgi:5-deoxy-glucuronate isomerase
VAKSVISSLKDTHRRPPRQSGLHLIQPRGEGGAEALASWRLRLASGESATFSSADEEAVVVLQEGRATWSAGDDTWTVSRRGVFAERATALYLPPGTTFTAQGLEGSGHPDVSEAIIISAPAPSGGAATLLRPDAVDVLERGRGAYSRTVHNLFVTDRQARRIMIGETFNPPGHWSSFPPHKHDGRDGEPRLEEIYHYRIDPPQGFGHQMQYTTHGESVTHIVHDGDVVVLPYGYHPVSAPPGYQLYYLWAMVGDERKLALFEDPAHAWIHQA